MGGEYADESNDDIISASVQTLGRLNSSRALRFNWSGIDKLIVDEAHHSVSDAYGRIFDYAGVLHSDANKLLLGVTATSQRPDGRALSDVFEKIPFVYSIRQAITDKWLVPIKGFRVTTDTDLSGVEQSHGDLVLSQLSKAVDTPTRNRHSVAEWKKLAGSRKTSRTTGIMKAAMFVGQRRNNKSRHDARAAFMSRRVGNRRNHD